MTVYLFIDLKLIKIKIDKTLNISNNNDIFGYQKPNNYLIQERRDLHNGFLYWSKI